MLRNFKNWLERDGYVANVVASRIANVARIEREYGNIDDHFARDHLQALEREFAYSTDDERARRPNGTKIKIDGDLRTGLATCKSAVLLYRRFRDETIGEASAQTTFDDQGEVFRPPSPDDSLRFSLEQDLQTALRQNIAQLEPSLCIADGGQECNVTSGRIDITARDASGAKVVIELKARTAGQSAVAQILSYMGDLQSADPNAKIRGILIAADFDTKATAAARMVPSLALRRYRIKFDFSDATAP